VAPEQQNLIDKGGNDREKSSLHVPLAKTDSDAESGDLRHDGAAAPGAPRVNGHRDLRWAVRLNGLKGPGRGCDLIGSRS
jgi:hypothetical protein